MCPAVTPAPPLPRTPGPTPLGWLCSTPACCCWGPEVCWLRLQGLEGTENIPPARGLPSSAAGSFFGGGSGSRPRFVGTGREAQCSGDPTANTRCCF